MTIRTGALGTQKRKGYRGEGGRGPPWGLLGLSSNHRDFMGLWGPCRGPLPMSQASVTAFGSLAWTPYAELERCQPELLAEAAYNAPLQGWEAPQCGQHWETGKSEDTAIWVRLDNQERQPERHAFFRYLLCVWP